MTRKDVKGLVFILFFALAAAFVFNYVSPYGIALIGQWDTSKGVVTAKAKNGDPVQPTIEINNPVLVKQIHKNKERIIIDVRLREIYNQGHLPGALSFPLVDFDDHIEQLLNLIDRQAAILVYCSGFGCTDSHTFARRLINLNFSDVKVFPGGFRQWQEMGYEIEKNED